jgi:signal transduction histidine kinase
MNNKKATSDPDEFLELRMEHEAITYFFHNTSMSSGRILSKSLVVLIVAAVMWSLSELWLVVVWVLLMVFGIVVHDYVARKFGKAEVSLEDISKWTNKLVVSRVYFGILWALAIIFFSSNDSPEHLLFLSTVALMLSFGSVVVGVHRLSMFYLYAGPIMLALLIRFILEWSLVLGALAVFVLWSFFASLIFANDLYLSMRSQMRLRLESNDLAEVLQMSNEEAKEGIREKSRLLAAASHDLRQPLHAVQLFMNVFKDAVTEAEREKVFERIEVSVNSLTRLFDSILDMSRLDAEVVIPEWSHFDVSTLLDELTGEFAVMAEEKGIKLRLRTGKFIVKSDRELLERVLRNLISNAIRYSEEGGVLISARRRGERVLLQVWDTGIGISEEDKEKIYIEFQQLNTVRDDRVQGFGLGLAMVRRFCQLLGYTITLESIPLRGSVFALSIEEGDAGMMAQDVPAPQAVRWDLAASW